MTDPKNPSDGEVYWCPKCGTRVRVFVPAVVTCSRHTGGGVRMVPDPQERLT